GAIKSTIPKGWSRPKALRRWLSLPFVELDLITQAWRDYLDDAREKSESSKYPQRIMYPENWLRDRVYEMFIEAASAQIQSAGDNTQMRGKTIQQWNGYGERVAEAITPAVFDAWLNGSRLISVNEHEFIIAHSRPFAVKWLREHSSLLGL